MYFATLVGSIVAYRISPFHPLANYPGPFVAKISKLWMVCPFIPASSVCSLWADGPTQLFISSTGKPHEYYARLHEKYGDIVRIGGSPPSPIHCGADCAFKVPMR